MTSKQEHDTYKKRKNYDLNPFGGVHVHSNNTLLHEVCKTIVCYELSRAGREWETEATLNDSGDRADIVDFGNVDESPVAIEVQNDTSPGTIRDKLDRYLDAGLRDVIVLDLNECPEGGLDQIREWVQSELLL